MKGNAIPDELTILFFLPKRSTLSQLLSVVDEWDRLLDTGSTVHACFVNMAKAFDHVDQALLIHNLSTLGVSKKELFLFPEHFTWGPARIGSKSWSFIIFYRDLPGKVESSCAMFADDTYCLTAALVPATLNTTAVFRKTFLGWTHGQVTGAQPSTSESPNLHTLLNSQNRKKSSHPHPTLSLSGGTNPLVSASTTHLGVRLSCSLLWSEHVSQAIQHVHFKVFTLKRLARRPGSCNLLKHLYLSLVRPAFHVEYACVGLMLEA